jgi:predicted ferric reductase
VWVGLGTIGFYLMILVTVTFYMRRKIGQKAFKSIHTLSLLSYLGVVFHAFFAGSDSSLGTVQLIYFSSFMVVLFLTAYWLIHARDMKKKKEARLIISKSSQVVKR